jgi:hypothetical protein
MIDAREGRNVATAGIPKAFLQTKYDESPNKTLMAKLNKKIKDIY